MWDCLDRQPSLRVVACEQFGLAVDNVRELVRKSFGGPSVKRTSRLAKQCAVCCVLYERVLEQVARVRRQPLLEMPTRVCRPAWVLRPLTTATTSSPAHTARRVVFMRLWVAEVD